LEKDPFLPPKNLLPSLEREGILKEGRIGPKRIAELRRIGLNFGNFLGPRLKKEERNF